MFFIMFLAGLPCIMGHPGSHYEISSVDYRAPDRWYINVQLIGTFGEPKRWSYICSSSPSCRTFKVGQIVCLVYDINGRPVGIDNCPEDPGGDGDPYIPVICISGVILLVIACCIYSCYNHRKERRAQEQPAGRDADLQERVLEARKTDIARVLRDVRPELCQGDVCSICLDRIENDAVQLVCIHYYHKTCITTWLCHNDTCPICKNNLFEVAEV